MTEQDKELYKFASVGLKKKALSDDAKAGLIGALAGGGVGLASHLMTPEDEDESTTKRLLSHVLAGAAFGGLAGYGGKKLYDAAKPAPAPQESWSERHLDPDLSTVLGGVSLASGGVAAKKGYNKLLTMFGDNSGRKILFDAAGKEIPYDKLSNAEKAVADAYTKANNGSIQRRILDLFRKKKLQPGLDEGLNKAIAAARPGMVSGVVGGKPSIPNGFWHNQRRMLNAFKGAKGGKRALATALATGLAALLVRSVGKSEQ